MTRRSVGVYSAPSQTFTSKYLANPCIKPDLVHLECVYRRRAGESTFFAKKRDASITDYTALSLTARLAIGMRCFTDYCHSCELNHAHIDAFLEDMWNFPLSIGSPKAFTEWEEVHPHLVDVGLGDDFSDDFQSFLLHNQISPQDFRNLIESLVEIVFASFYGASENQQSFDSLSRVIDATVGMGVIPPPPDKFAVSLFIDNHGWGKPLSEEERNQWRFANT